MNEELVRALEIFVANMKGQLGTILSLSQFITEETHLNGKRFSFEDHFFQEYVTNVIEQSFGKTVSIMKISQIGLSEIVNRIILAIMAVRAGTGCIISFPSKTMSQEVFKTRFSPIIDSSPRLSNMICREVDSASVKQLSNGSIMYALSGSTGSKSTLLNRPANLVIVDEFDKQDIDVVSGYTSRAGHSSEENCLTINLSTPTVANFGIDAEIKESRYIHVPWIKCDECGHEFIGDYYTHVKVPGFDKSLEYLTKNDAIDLDLSLSYLECPSCLCHLTKHNKSTVWKIVENPKGLIDKIGIMLDPFVAMGFLTMSKLVKSSVKYTSKTEFLNQGLGRVAELSDSTIDVDSIQFGHSEREGLPIFGLDMGKLCHYVRGILHHDSTIHVAEIRVIPLPELDEFIEKEFQRYYFAAAVMDAGPYSDIVYRYVKKYETMFSAIYVDPAIPKPELYTINMSDKYDETVRQVNINKNMFFTTFAEDLPNFYTFEPNPLHQHLLVQHLRDMRKVRDYSYEEIRYKWVKSKGGNDHLFHSCVFLAMAAKLAQAQVVNHYASFIGIKAFNSEKKKK